MGKALLRIEGMTPERVLYMSKFEGGLERMPGWAVDLGKEQGRRLTAQLHALGPEAELYVAAGFSIADVYGFVRDGGSINDRELLARAGLNPDQMCAHMEELSAEYERLGVPDNAQTRPRFVQTGLGTVLGRGLFNTVSLIQVVGQDGRSNECAFKPLAPPVPKEAARPDAGYAATVAGIDPRDPKVAERNLVASGLDKLALDIAEREGVGKMPSVYPDTSLVLGGRPPGLGVAMEYVKGTAAAKLTDTHFRSPEFRRQAIWLQCLDAVLGQVDRHSNNFMVVMDAAEKITRLVGIDNDACCGTGADPEALRKLRGSHSCGLPPVIDTQMEAVIMAMKPDDIRELMADRLPGLEGAAIGRLNELQVRVTSLRKNDAIIAPTDWSGATATELLASVNTSYVGRDLALFRELGPES